MDSPSTSQSHPFQVYMIDFGLTKMYRDLKTHKHIPYKGNKQLTGTALARMQYAKASGVIEPIPVGIHENPAHGLDNSSRDGLRGLMIRAESFQAGCV